MTLYSLEKLIEWKQQFTGNVEPARTLSLYSLEKLIEWKPIESVTYGEIEGLSLLAREIN